MFFETCGDKMFDADMCVQQMQDIAAALNNLGEDGRFLVMFLAMQTPEATARNVRWPDLHARIAEIGRSLGWHDG